VRPLGHDLTQARRALIRLGAHARTDGAHGMHSPSRNPAGVPLRSLAPGSSFLKNVHVPESQPEQCEGKLSSLSSLCDSFLPPDWCTFNNPDAQLSTLRTFLSAHFFACVDQGKVLQLLQQDGSASFAVFNTSLIARNSDEPIFAVLSSNPDPSSPPSKPWGLFSWVTETELTAASQPWNASHTLHKGPNPATLVPDPTLLVFWPSDRTAEFATGESFDESIDALADVFPPAFQNNACVRHVAVMDAMRRARRRALYEPGVAVPQYCKRTNEVQLLLPLKIDTSDSSTHAHLALVLCAYSTRKGERVYRATSVQRLRTAYMNARIVMPIYQPWLLAGVSDEAGPGPENDVIAQPLERAQGYTEQQKQQEQQQDYETFLQQKWHPQGQARHRGESGNVSSGHKQSMDGGNSSGLSWGDEIEDEGNSEDARSSPTSFQHATTISGCMQRAQNFAAAASKAPPAKTDAYTGTSHAVTIAAASSRGGSASANANGNWAASSSATLKPRADESLPEIAAPKLNIPALPESFVHDYIIPGNRDETELPLLSDAEAAVAVAVERFGSVRSVLVREHKQRKGCYFAIVDFARWTDLHTRSALVKEEKLNYPEFYLGETVFMRKHMDKALVQQQQQQQQQQHQQMENGSNGGPPTRDGWAKTRKTTKDGKSLYRGKCTSCGFHCEVPFRPVTVGEPPCCKACVQEMRQHHQQLMADKQKQALHQQHQWKEQEHGAEDAVANYDEMHKSDKQDAEEEQCLKRSQDGEEEVITKEMRARADSSSGDETETVVFLEKEA